MQTLARARTLTVLTRLKGARRGSVVRFLYESGLITKDPLILDLRSADLSCAYLRGAQLNYANLERSDLSGANFREADLSYAYLFQADLSGANLSEAVLRKTSLSGANLREADLREAHLREADLLRADLREADLREADLSYANLKGADLSGANLRGAILSEVDLVAYSGFRIDLSRADLSETYLVGVRGPTDEQLEQVKTLEGATMPNGQKYEDWRKDKEGRGEEGEHTGPS